MQKNMLMKISKSIAVAVTVAMTASMPVTALAAPANFNAAYYAAQNPDVVKAVGNSYEALARHYDLFGMREGRNAYSGDVKAAFIRLANSQYKLGRGIASVFDAKWYAAHNPDAVKVFGNDPAKLFEHFIIYGLSEGRTPSETFNADTFFSENKEMAVLVAAAFADKPEVVNSPILQVAREVSTTYIPAPVSAPENNNVSETVTNTDNNTNNNNDSKGNSEEKTPEVKTPVRSSSPVITLAMIQEMASQASRKVGELQSQVNTMNNDALAAETLLAEVNSKLERVQENGITVAEKDQLMQDLYSVINSALEATNQAGYIQSSAMKVSENTRASFAYLETYKTMLDESENTISAQKAYVQNGTYTQANLATANANLAQAGNALINAQKAYDSAKATLDAALAAVQSLSAEKEAQATLAATANAEFLAAQQALTTASAQIASTGEVNRLLSEREVFRSEYNKLTEEDKASNIGEVLQNEINKRTAEADRIANELTTDLRDDLVVKANANNAAQAKLTALTSNLAAAEEEHAAAVTAEADASTALSEAKENYIETADEELQKIDNEQAIADSCGNELAAAQNAILGIVNATDGVIRGTEEHPSSLDVVKDAQEAIDIVKEAETITPTEDTDDQNNDTDDTQNDTTPADENQNNTNPTDNTQSSGTQNQPEQND